VAGVREQMLSVCRPVAVARVDVHELRQAAEAPREEAVGEARERAGVEEVGATRQAGQAEDGGRERQPRGPAPPAPQRREVGDAPGGQTLRGVERIGPGEDEAQLPAVARGCIVQDLEGAQHARMARVAERHDRASQSMTLARVNGCPSLASMDILRSRSMDILRSRSIDVPRFTLAGCLPVERPAAPHELAEAGPRRHGGRDPVDRAAPRDRLLDQPARQPPACAGR